MITEHRAEYLIMPVQRSATLKMDHSEMSLEEWVRSLWANKATPINISRLKKKKFLPNYIQMKEQATFGKYIQKSF